VTDVLKGVRVVELSTVITAPLTGLMLADLGADVIKVEPPRGGDPFRNFRGGQYSPNFVAYNRGKRSIQLDLRSEAGHAFCSSSSRAPTCCSRTIAPVSWISCD
jgi:crotonobetainyl-CoA:carnitine CoA-transferase CaiB-like acyl-CoA transferase